LKTPSFVFAAIFGSLFLCQIAYGQFIPYSQYNNVPLQTNPAVPSLTKYTQFAVHYRRSRIANYDLPSVSFIHPFYRRSNGLQYGGVGVNVVSQHAGPGGIYKVTGATGTFAYTIHLSKQHRIGAGIAGGVVNKRIDMSRITTDMQYNLGSYDPSLSSGENFQSGSVTKTVINAGLCWVITDVKDRDRVSFGVAAYNMNKPAFDLLPDSPADDMTYIVTGEMALLTRGRVTLSPTFRYIRQGASIANIGGRIMYAVNADNELSTGIWYKTTRALVFSAQYNAKAYFIGVSTDLSIASGQDANINNAVELGFGWRMKRKAQLQPGKKFVREQKSFSRSRKLKPSKTSSARASRKTSRLVHRTPVDSTMTSTREVESLPTTPVIYFDPASAEVPDDRKPFLEDLASALKRYPKTKLKITGHSCTEGDQEVNKQISTERANAVAKILMENGVPENQLNVMGMGTRKPVGSNRTKAGRQKIAE
jgi:type IX secretion system PorP/SprF family membrane protein